MIEKLTSRKFWVAIISIIAGVLGVLGANDNIIQLVSSAGLILVPAVIYIITEGKIDAAALSSVDADALIEAIKKYFLSNSKETETEETSNGVESE